MATSCHHRASWTKYLQTFEIQHDANTAFLSWKCLLAHLISQKKVPELFKRCLGCLGCLGWWLFGLFGCLAVCLFGCLTVWLFVCLVVDWADWAVWLVKTRQVRWKHTFLQQTVVSPMFNKLELQAKAVNQTKMKSLLPCCCQVEFSQFTLFLLWKSLK